MNHYLKVETLGGQIIADKRNPIGKARLYLS